MRFAETTVVDALTLEVRAGEICVMLGPNGAGKSTTLKMLTGLLKPSAGTVRVAGLAPADARAKFGVLPENLGLFEELTVEEHLRLSADVYQVPDADARIAQLLRVLNLEHGRDTYASRCSHGMRKKTAFAMALLHNPRVLFLDEPFEAIDPVSTQLMCDVLVDAAASGATVFLTSHILPLVERIGHRFLFLRKGRIVLDSRRDALPRPLADLYFELVEAPKTEKLEWLTSAQS